VLAKEHLEASEAQRKFVSFDKGAGRGFQKSHPQVTRVATSQAAARQEQGTRGGMPLATKPGKGQRND